MNIWTGVGRLVSGHPLVERTTGFGGKAMTNMKGEPKTEYYIGLALPKSDPKTLELIANIKSLAAAAWPGGESTFSTFSMKIKDGDLPEFSKKEGYPGNYVLSCSTGLAIKCVGVDGKSWIVDPAEIKCGYYIRVFLNVKSNKYIPKPGMFLNPSHLQLVGYGEIIETGMGIEEAMASAPPVTLPPGASATPVAGPPPVTATPPPVTQGTPPPPVGGITPAPDFLNPETSVPAPVPVAAPAAPAPVPEPVMSAECQANGWTYAFMLANNWTDATLKAAGHMA